MIGGGNIKSMDMEVLRECMGFICVEVVYCLGISEISVCNWEMGCIELIMIF